MFRFLTIFVAACACSALTSARALTISLTVDPNLPPGSTAYVFGAVSPGAPATDADEAAYINGILGLSLGGTGTTNGNAVYRALNTFSPLPTATATGALDGTATNILLPTGYTYLVAKYGGQNGGTEVWYIGGFAAGTNISIPQNAFGNSLSATALLDREPGRTTIYTLPPGGVQNPALPSGFPVGGTVLATTSTPFSSGTVSGTLNSSVILGDTANPYGGLTFTYSLSVSPSSVDSASELTVTSFAGFLTDVSFNQTGGGVASSNFTRSSGTGYVVRSEWVLQPIMPGQTSALVVVQTDATNFQSATAGVTDGQTVSAASLGPAGFPILPSINGVICFTGGATTDTSNLGTAAAMTGYTFLNVLNGQETGDYTPLNAAGNGSGTLTFSPFGFGGNVLSPNPLVPLWTITYLGVTYSFDATSVSVATQVSTYLNIWGTGIAHITGFADTPGSWSITATTQGGSVTFTFGAAATVSPTNWASINTQPASQFVQIGSNATFNVMASGSRPLNYQWQFNNSLLAGQTNASLSLTNVQFGDAGGYSVVVTNIFGSTNSAVAQLTVFTNLVFTQTNRMLTFSETNFWNPISSTQLLAFVSGSFTTNATLDTNKMTVVLTHGWIPTFPGPAQADGVQGWPTNIAALIHDNLVQTPNIVAWDWTEAAKAPLPGTAAGRTPDQGIALGEALTNALGPNYLQPIHFIGHSLGTLVNAYAANFLQGTNWANEPVSSAPWPATNMQMTLFDEAEAATDITSDVNHWLADVEILIGLNNPLLPKPSYWHPLPRDSIWADNYVAAFGLLHPEAANVILTNGSPTDAPDVFSFFGALKSFHGYPIDWYDETVQNDGASVMGFRWSFEEGGWFTNAPPTNSVYVQADNGSLWNLTLTNWQYGTNLLNQRYGEYVSELGFSALQTVPTTAEYYGGVIGQSVYAGINNGWNMVVNLETSLAGALPLANLSPRPLGGTPNGSSVTNVPAYAWIPLNVPSNAVSMSFDFMLQGNGNNDSFQVALNGTNVLSLETSLIQTNVTMNSGLIDVSPYAGQQVELFLGIVGGTSTNASVTISNFQFYVVLPPSLQAQLSGTNFVVSWSLSAANYVLETTDNLSTTNSWTAVTNIPVIVNLQNTVTNPPSGGSRFYRLRSQ